MSLSSLGSRGSCSRKSLSSDKNEYSRRASNRWRHRTTSRSRKRPHSPPGSIDRRGGSSGRRWTRISSRERGADSLDDRSHCLSRRRPLSPCVQSSVPSKGLRGSPCPLCKSSCRWSKTDSMSRRSSGRVGPSARGRGRYVVGAGSGRKGRVGPGYRRHLRVGSETSCRVESCCPNGRDLLRDVWTMDETRSRLPDSQSPRTPPS